MYANHFYDEIMDINPTTQPLTDQSNISSFFKELRNEIERWSGIQEYAKRNKFDKLTQGRRDICPRKENRKTFLSCSKYDRFLCKNLVIMKRKECDRNKMD